MTEEVISDYWECCVAYVKRSFYYSRHELDFQFDAEFHAVGAVSAEITDVEWGVEINPMLLGGKGWRDNGDIGSRIDYKSHYLFIFESAAEKVFRPSFQRCDADGWDGVFGDRK